MIIARPSMSTKAVIMRTVSFPFILFSRHQRGRYISNYAQRFRRDLVHCVLGRVMWRVHEIDHVDHSQPGVEERDVIICDQPPAFLNENVAVSEIGGGLPDARNDFRRLL